MMSVFCLSLFAQDKKQTFLKPISIKYHKTEMSGADNQARYYVKVNGGHQGCFGYTGAMHETGQPGPFENLSNFGLFLDNVILIGQYSLNQTIDIRFDGWVSNQKDKGNSWTYGNGDLEKSDASATVALSNLPTRITAKGSHFEIVFDVLQKPKTGGSGGSPFGM